MFELAAKESLATYSLPRERKWSIREDESMILLSIRGSIYREDWWENIKFLFLSDDVHRGFENIAEQVFDEVLEENAHFSCCPKDLVFTGHSLGGVIATILPTFFGRDHGNIKVVSFGAPRPGGRNFKKRLKKTGAELYRFIHGNDGVVWTPPFTCGYVHPCKPIVLKDQTNPNFGIANDHDMALYEKALLQWMREGGEQDLKRR